MSPKVAVVILNWNGAGLLKQFLPSVIEFSGMESTRLIVADNFSDDDSVEILRKEFPKVEVFQLDRNFGFARGYNESLKQVEADYFVILNSDVEVTAGWLEKPVSLMEADSSIAAVQPKILSYHQKTHFEYAGAAGGFIDKYGYPLCRGRIFNVVEADHGQYDSQTDIFWATGACMFVRAANFKESGGFDPDFWAHMEEIDLCWRLKNKGYRIVYTPESTVYHLGGGTLSYNNPHKLFLNFRNNLWLLYKNLPSNKLFSVIFSRMILDSFAAFKLLAEFNFNGIKSVLKAHYQFYRSLPELRRKRNVLKVNDITEPKEKLQVSVVWQFYFRKRKKYNELEF
jgi:GT2 family glycosyltransferase